MVRAELSTDEVRADDLASALWVRGLRHGYAEHLGKIDVEEVARWCIEALAHIDGSPS